ncbi:hypothetical protein CLU79DRAFT_771289 [Phycomyces nitens]|nr:hypothetical protein CLU79DRAFT_771289 [Phycomyces nitens]
MAMSERDNYYSRASPTSPAHTPDHNNMQSMSGYPPSPFESNSQGKTEISDPDTGYQRRTPGYSNFRDSESDDTYMADRHNSTEILARSSVDPSMPRVRNRDERRSCCDRICCGCCNCCFRVPRWLRYCGCIFLLLIIILAIVIGVLVAIFKEPEVTVNGLGNTPQYNLAGSNLNLNFTLDIGVNNPNIESVTFESIVAKAYYPNYDNLELGGGQKEDVKINSNGVTNITFPFDISIDAANGEYAPIFNDLITKCGLTGGEKENIVVNYVVVLTLRILGIAIKPTIRNKASFPCPLTASDLSSLPGLSDIITSVKSNIP